MCMWDGWILFNVIFLYDAHPASLYSSGNVSLSYPSLWNGNKKTKLINMLAINIAHKLEDDENYH